MGLTTWKNSPKGKIRKADVSIAKNYLTEDELKDLNLIVDQYLSFAELQARNRNPMYMSDWLKKLNDFMTLNDREILEHAGTISAKLAKELAEAEYEKHRKKMIDFEDAKEIKELEEGLKGLENKKKKSNMNPWHTVPSLPGIPINIWSKTHKVNAKTIPKVFGIAKEPSIPLHPHDQESL